VCAYSAADLKAIFKSATAEEEILFRFFLGMGMREREVMFASWRDLEFERGFFMSQRSLTRASRSRTKKRGSSRFRQGSWSNSRSDIRSGRMNGGYSH